jgi:hypothetical protein
MDKAGTVNDGPLIRSVTMAKLSARGRQEIARYERVREDDYGKVKTSWALMTDGWILVKDQGYNDNGTIRTGTWSQWRRIKAGKTPEVMMVIMRGWKGVTETVKRADLVDKELRRG